MRNLFSKENLIIFVLLLYSYFNIRAIYPFLFDEDHVSILFSAVLQNGGVGFFGIIIGLFLNAAMVLYFLKK